MIKQIWFVRNITKLFVSLSFTINIVITLYVGLSAFALTEVFGDESLVVAMFEQFSGLLFFPFIGWCLFTFFFGLEIYLKRARKKFLKHKQQSLTQVNLTYAEEMRLLFLSKFITSSNFSTSLTFAFFSIDVVSKAKDIPSFGMFPIVLCWIATIYYYITLVLEFVGKSKLHGS